METGISLLVTDDEPIIRLAMQEALESGGYHVITAPSGDAAIARLAEGKSVFSGLVTDIRLGDGLDGWALARRARELSGNICVLYVTGDSAADWLVEGVPKSVVLQKPFADAQLLTAISMLLNEQANVITSERADYI